MFNVLIYCKTCSDPENSVRFWIFVRFYRGIIWNVYRVSTKKMVWAIFFTYFFYPFFEIMSCL